jgi:predicted MPP superfamily phosphohydrolase
MDSFEVLSSDSVRRKPKRQWAEKVFDAMVLTALVILPLGLVFAVYQLLNGTLLLAVLGLLAAGLGALGVYARLIVPFRLRVQHLEIGATPVVASGATGAAAGAVKGAVSGGADTPPLTVVFFTDLHVGRVKQAEWTRKVVDLVNAQHPDVVLLGGDYVGHVDADVIPRMLAPLADLRAPLGVYAVLGNHDYGLPGVDYSALLQGLFRQMNIRLLRNENVTLGDRLELIGIDELWEGYADVPRAFAGAKLKPGMRRIVLGHDPDLMAQIRQPADLFIFGHTHGGQIYIPYFSRFIVPVEGKLFRGLYHQPQGPVYVSHGCGETTTPTRLGTRAEIVSITVH